MTAGQLEAGMASTAQEIRDLPETEDREYDDDHSIHNADAFIRTSNEIRALPETQERGE